MTLVKTGGGITDIRGGFGGVYFHRDKSGLHSCAKPRTVHRRSAAQNVQRNAFIAARALSKDNRVVSYLMYLYMNGLPLLRPLVWLSPTGHFDPSIQWINEEYAYDDNTLTFAQGPSGVNKWSGFLELITAKINCSKFRFWSERAQPLIDIDVHDATGWHNVYYDTFVTDQWVEKVFASRMIDRIRLQFWQDSEYPRINELDFLTAPDPPYYPPPVCYSFGIW